MARSAIHRPGAGHWAYANLAAALGHLGRGEDARAMLDKTIELNPDFSRQWFDSIFIGADPSLVAIYFGVLRKAGLDMPDESQTGD